MSDGLLSEIKAQRRKNTRLLFVTLLISLPLFLILVGKPVEIQVYPVEARAEANIEFITGFGIPLQTQYLVFSDATEFMISSPGFTAEKALYEKSAETSVIEVSLKPLPGLVIVEVDGSANFEIHVPSLGLRSKTRSFQFEAPAGALAIEIDGPNIQKLVKNIEVLGRGLEQIVAVELKEVRGSIALTVVPSHATVSLDSVQVNGEDGRYQFKAAVGGHTINIAADGYVSNVLEVYADESSEVRLDTITLKPKSVQVTLASRPAKATVLIDGKYLGETPLSLSLMPLRDYRYQVRKSGFEPVLGNLEVELGKDIARDIVLAKERYTVNVEVFPASKVILNGVEKGVSSIDLMVSAGDIISAEKAGYATEEFLIPAVKLEDRNIRFRLIEADRKLFVESPDIEEVEGVTLLKLEGRTFGVPDNLRLLMQSYVPDLYVSDTVITAEAYARFSGGDVDGDVGQLPQNKINWQDAALYCNWLSEKLALRPFYIFGEVRGVNTISFDQNSNGFRMPTLGEWVVLMSAGSPEKIQMYPWGEKYLDIPRGIGNLAGRELGQYSSATMQHYVDNYAGLSPVKSFRPNALNLYDLVGNVREWLHDAAVENTEYFGAAYGIQHRTLGSSYLSASPEALESIAVGSAIYGADDLGFRVVRTIR